MRKGRGRLQAKLDQKKMEWEDWAPFALNLNRIRKCTAKIACGSVTGGRAWRTTGRPHARSCLPPGRSYGSTVRPKMSANQSAAPFKLIPKGDSTIASTRMARFSRPATEGPARKFTRPVYLDERSPSRGLFTRHDRVYKGGSSNWRGAERLEFFNKNLR